MAERIKPKDVFGYSWGINGIAGIVIICISLIALIILIGNHFKPHAEVSISPAVEGPRQAATGVRQVTAGAQRVVQVEQQTKDPGTMKTGDYQEKATPVQKVKKHYTKKHYYTYDVSEDSKADIETRGDGDTVVDVSIESTDTSTETVRTPNTADVDYWSSVNKYTEAVENQSKEIDKIIKKMNGGQ